jgi:hypothetical protein
MADKILSIGLGANTSGLKKDMDNAAAIVKNAGQQMGDAVMQSSDKISASSKRSGENLQQAYRAAARDAREAALQFGETSDKFRVAAKTAGELKDRLDLTNSTIKAFSSDAPVLSATVGVMQSLAGAFSAAQGAAALFGTDSKALQETMVKLQGAMALTQGLQSLKEAGDSFMVLKTVITLEVLPAIASIGATTAIATAGITLIIGALVALSIETMGNTKKAQEDYIRLINEAARAQASLNTAIQDSVTKQRALALLQAEASGDKGTLEREKAKQDYEIAVEANRKTYLESQKNLFDQMRYRDTLKSLTEIYKNKQNEIEKGILDDLKKNNKQIQDEHKKHVEEIRKMNSEMRSRGGTDEGIYLIQRKKATGVSFGAQSNDELRQGIIKNLEAAKLNVPQTVTFTFKAEGLDDIQKAGQRMVVLNDGMKKMGETLKGMIVPALQNFGNLLGKALGGDNVDAGAALKAMLADMCNAMAMTMYAMAAGYAAVHAYGYAAAATAAGVGLNIAAGVLGAGASGGGVSAGGGGGGGSAVNAGTFGNGGMNSNFGVLQVGGEIRGNNLLVSVNRSGYERGRVR